MAVFQLVCGGGGKGNGSRKLGAVKRMWGQSEERGEMLRTMICRTGVVAHEAGKMRMCRLGREAMVRVGRIKQCVAWSAEQVAGWGWMEASFRFGDLRCIIFSEPVHAPWPGVSRPL